MRAYATNVKGTAYGNQQTFTTSVTKPTVSLSSVILNGTNGATCISVVSSNGGDPLSARGVCWSTTETPTISDPHTSDGTAIGSVNSSISGLANSTTYYVRAYATNSVGIAYSNEVKTVTVPSEITLPSINLYHAYSITRVSVMVNGVLGSDGGDIVTACGFCWSETHNPTLSNYNISISPIIGYIGIGISDLSPGTAYYVRAYATNSKGTIYSNELEFTTLSATVPILTTNAISDITQISATCGGLISDTGGAAITVSGICWSTLSEPTIDDAKTTDGSTGYESFSSNMVGLLPNTTYYVRAYATNSVGTGYGNEVSFKTANLVVRPSFSDLSATYDTPTNFEVLCNIDCGGGVLTEKGVSWYCIETGESGYVSDTSTSNSELYVRITVDSQRHTYYVRAHAVNSAGESYSSEYTYVHE